MKEASRRLRAWIVTSVSVPMILAGTLMPAGLSLAAPAKAKRAAAQTTRKAAGKPQPEPPAPPALAAAIRDSAGGKLDEFYRARGYRPMWIVKGHPSQATRDLLVWLDDARYDGLRPSRYEPDKLRQALREAQDGGSKAVAAADVLVSRAFVRYVQDMRRLKDVGITFVGEGLKPPRLSDSTILRVAAMHSAQGYVSDMGWMSPHYLRMRKLYAIGLDGHADDQTLRRLRLDLERARALPSPYVRHIVVDAVTARLWYYENGRQVGTMKVVVGALKTQTPLLAGWVNWTVVNPYWNIPDYLARDNIARKVLSGRSLESMHMQVLSDWSTNAQVLDPEKVDWQAVADGKIVPRIRELPGPANSMGQMKFIFPNSEGIYLHDTPNRDLLDKDDRHLSNGCVRLERAPELGKWMMGRAVVTKGKPAETPEALPAPVPVYLTYLTATAKGNGVALLEDVYGRDK